MRRYDEPIEVRSAEVGGERGPAQFLWRRRLWRVVEVQSRWRETADWWSRPGGEDDLLAESVVWRVLADAGRSSEPGVYDLCCPTGGDAWTLRAVVD